MKIQSRPGCQTEPIQAGRGQHGGVRRAAADLLEARIHIAADLGEGGVRQLELDLQPPSRAAGRDHPRHSDALAHDQDVAGVFARQITRDHEAGG